MSASHSHTRKRRQTRHAPTDDSLRVELERDDAVYAESAVPPNDEEDDDVTTVIEGEDSDGALNMPSDHPLTAIAHAVDMCSTQIRALDSQIDELRAMHMSLQKQVDSLHAACSTLRDGLQNVQVAATNASAGGGTIGGERLDERLKRIEHAVARGRKGGF